MVRAAPRGLSAAMIGPGCPGTAPSPFAEESTDAPELVAPMAEAAQLVPPLSPPAGRAERYRPPPGGPGGPAGALDLSGDQHQRLRAPARSGRPSSTPTPTQPPFGELRRPCSGCASRARAPFAGVTPCGCAKANGPMRRRGGPPSGSKARGASGGGRGCGHGGSAGPRGPSRGRGPTGRRSAPNTATHRSRRNPLTRRS
jgi:hypothetical protein